MPNVVLTVDCEGAMHERCYTAEYVQILEEEFVPCTWLIHVSLRDPSANTNLYYREFIHRIPSWHEIGVKVNFENERGYVEDPKIRGRDPLARQGRAEEPHDQGDGVPGGGVRACCLPTFPT